MKRAATGRFQGEPSALLLLWILSNNINKEKNKEEKISK
jgi:hypothetical protein